MKNNKYNNIINDIWSSVDVIDKVTNNEEMATPYEDSFTTEEQRKRDKKVTELLEGYVDNYKNRINSNKNYKMAITITCLCILLIFSIAFVYVMVNVGQSKIRGSIGGVIELISVCVTFLALIVSILKIITQYVFPKHEEEYITRIVELIQKNDLENKKENIKVQSKRLSKKK